MTQLTLGLDCDSGPAAVQASMSGLRPGPSGHPDLVEWLVAQGIESMSLNHDTVIETWLRLANRESLQPVA